MQLDHLAELINLLDLSMVPKAGETAVDDFAVERFKVKGYIHQLARTRVAKTWEHGSQSQPSMSKMRTGKRLDSLPWWVIS